MSPLSPYDPGKHGRTNDLSFVLLKVTLLVALVLGGLTALVQLSMDLSQQKDAVEVSAESFLDSIAPSAATSVYNYYDEGAEQIATGLFTQRAIRSVQILNGSDIMIEKDRALEPTLPNIGLAAKPDEVRLTRNLIDPSPNSSEVIGRLSIIVDRSIVPPAIVRRMVTYFVLSTIKNLVFGVALVALVYTALTRHIVRLADAAAHWRPGKHAVNTPKPPRFLRGTEVELLGEQITKMSSVASDAIQQLEHQSHEIQKDNTALNQKSTELTAAVEQRTQELNAANRALQRQADLDSLTGLANRRSFEACAIKSVAEAAERGGTVALVMIDLDHFKPFNDHYGHLTGDACLKKVAQALNTLASAHDVLVARYGGEEFICFIQNTNPQTAEAFAHNVHRVIAELNIPHERSSVADHITASLGIACETCDEATSIESLTSDADEALYEAKHKGRNRSILSSKAIRSRVRERRKVVSDLLQAIEERHFEPYFQSQVDGRTGEILGMEALARWRRPDQTILAPASFMDAAEENDLVRLIDMIIFEKCADFLRDAAARNLHVPHLSLNLSEDQLRDEGLMDRLVNLKKATDAAISVELLETTALDHPTTQLHWTIDKIRELGFGIDVDDFGTGKTSIVSLMTMRPSRLKIAKELVLPAPEEARNKRLLSSVIEIGKTLGISVIAEGVETEAHRQLLIDVGCTVHQGYLYARPLSHDRQLELLAKHETCLPRLRSGEA